MKTVVNDTANVVFTRKSDGQVIFTGETQLASISQSVQEEEVRGGIGNAVLAVIRSEKSIELTVRNALVDSRWLAMSQGVSFVSGSAVIFTTEESTITDNAGVLEATITGTVSTGGKVSVESKEGEELESSYSGTGTTVTITDVDATAGDKVTVIYQTDVTGDVLNIDAGSFSEAYSVEYHTVEYSPETDTIVKDLYFKFENVTPSDNFDLSFESGTAITPELSFTAKKPIGSDTIGQIIEVARTA